MARRDDQIAAICAFIESGRAVVVTASPGMGKTTTVRAVVELLSTPVIRAIPSKSARTVSFGAFAAVLPIAAGDSTSRMVAGIAFLRADRALLVVDDAHLLDDESAALVHLFAQERAVLVTRRADDAGPDGVSRLASGAEHIELDPLTAEEMTVLAERFVGGLVDTRTLETLHAASEGNPLWANEILGANQRADTLQCIDGVWSADELIGSLSVRELLRQRVEQWRAPVRHVATVLAAAGAATLVLVEELCGRSAVRDAIQNNAAHVRVPDQLLELSHPLLGEIVDALETNNARLVTLQALVSANAARDPKMFTILASWLLELGDNRSVDCERLTEAARRAFDGTNPLLAERLVDQAIRAGGGAVARELRLRIRASLGRPIEQPGAASDLYALAIGATEAFAYGFQPADEVRALLIDASSVETDHDRRVELRTFEFVVALQTGEPIEPIVRGLAEIAAMENSTEVVRSAAVAASTAMVQVGRYESALALARSVEEKHPSDNVFQNVAFRASTAEALLWVGRTGEAQQIGRTIQSFGGVAAPVAAVFGGGLDAQVALVQGDPTMAARILGSMVASMHGVDASGLRSWATAQLRWALAWAGQDPELDERIVPPPQGQLLGPRIRLFECMAAAEQGSLRVARRQALELADSAEAHGHYSTALHAVHLAGRIQVTQNLAERATGIASRVDGDVAGAVQDHLSALFTVNGAGLEKVGVTFESLGHLAYADEAFTNAAAAHRQRGKNTGAGRCAAEAHRLRSAGVMPTFAARRPEGTAISLTPRETEVVRLAATGLTNREVSAALGLSTRTVETHLQHAYTKLGINDRTQVSARLGESGRK